MNFKKLATEMSKSRHAQQAQNNLFVNIYTVHKHPKEAPDKFVVHLWVLMPQQGALLPTPQIWTCDELREAQRKIPRSSELFDRHATDDPEICETWIDWAIPNIIQETPAIVTPKKHGGLYPVR